MSTAVEFRNVTKRFGDFVAVDDLSLSVEKGQFVTLLGSSGSGKSTSLMMLAGFMAPTSGSIFIDGEDVTGVPPDRRNIGLVYQNYALFPHMTVAANVGFPLKMRHMSKSDISERVRASLEKVRLGAFADRFPAQLSGGQQQRVALARAMIFEPAILLMDEPLGALDKNLREEMQVEIKRIQQDAGITTIYVTHDQEEAMSMSDNVVVMSGGKIEQAAPPAELYEQPRNAFVAQFIGSANVLLGKFNTTDGQASFVSDAGASLPLAVPLPDPSGTRKTAIIRPERIRFTVANDPNAIKAVVETVLFGGTMIRYAVRAGEQRLDVVAVNDGNPPRHTGELVHLAWDPKDFLLVDGGGV
ncbi:ABC transporter ATP-binding protein [Sinorhizobium meliloti]|uniref:ABC transporter ATP-binding protein n=1 Tax=Rhizobium meliloti TaxID=382 RepID=UPI000FD86D37|nr:ABC transporter ATP-binding protein [Sinorhizobium meliloti]RVH62692.1 ABC transporter ATP-binding protein [Sinorhizobium meliloti]RVK62832.1 ABC transporter ATP-binding protein [Sinorhizobium meliloti]